MKTVIRNLMLAIVMVCLLLLGAVLISISVNYLIPTQPLYTIQDQTLHVSKQCLNLSYPDCIEECYNNDLKMHYCMDFIYPINNTHYMNSIYPGTNYIRKR